MNIYGAVVGAALGWIEAGGQRDLTEFQNAAAKRIAGYKNSARLSENLAKAAQGNLARWSQSLANKRYLENAGEALAASQINYRRAKDASVRGGFSNQLQRAEQAGMMAAMAGASGTRGSVVDSITQATALRASMAEESAKQAGEQRDFDARVRMKTIASQMIGGVNSSVILDNLDYATDVYQIKKEVSRTHSAVMGAMKGANMDFSNQSDPQRSNAEAQTSTLGQYSDDQQALANKGRQQFQFNYLEDQKAAYADYSNEGRNYQQTYQSESISTRDTESATSYWGIE